MDKNKLKAMVSLLDDTDTEVVSLIENQLKELGKEIIPMLEEEIAQNSLSTIIEQRIANFIHQSNLEVLHDSFVEWKEDGGIDLLHGLWLIAKYQFPDLKIEDLRSSIKEIYMEVWIRTQEKMHPQDTIKVLNDVVFNYFKFEPNIKNFHAVSNSYLNDVLSNKKGNPVALSCVYILLAEKLDLPIFGVNLPNLFVLTYDYPGMKFYINPFNRGQIFSASDIDDYLKQMKIEPDPKFYNSCSNLDIIPRILTNLSYAFNKIGKTEQQGEVNYLLDIFK